MPTSRNNESDLREIELLERQALSLAKAAASAYSLAERRANESEIRRIRYLISVIRAGQRNVGS
jgi:hypothetical protein